MPKAKSPAPTPPEPTDEEIVAELASLEARYGVATEAEVREQIGDHVDESLIAQGKGVVTPRIDRDAARIYAQIGEFLATASDEDRDAVPAMTESKLRVAIWSARQGSLAYQARKDGAKKAGAHKEERILAGAKARAAAITRRDQQDAALRNLAGGDPKWLTKIASAYGVIATPNDQKNAIDGQVALFRKMLADKSPAMVKRRKDTRITEAWLKASEAIGEAAKTDGELALAAQGGAGVTNASVDWWDGVNLATLGNYMEMWLLA